MRYLFGDYILDTQRTELKGAGAPIKLRRKAFQVLAYLLAHRDRVVPKHELLEHLWPDQFVGDAVLKACITALRKALGEQGRTPRFVRTLHGQGYCFVAAVEVCEHIAADVTALHSYSPLSAMRSAALPVGREEELTCLHAWLARALRGVRQVVFVTGEVGLGKTTVVEAFVAELGDHGPLWIGHGQCVEHYGAGEPYLPVLEALGRLCRGPGGKEVVALLGRQAPTWLMQMPGLVRAADLETLRHRIGGATRDRMLRELAEALELLTAQQPLVLVLEDLHWSDPSTLDLLAVVARRRESARLLLLGTYRPPEVRSRAHPLHTVQQELQLHGYGVELPLTLLTEDAVAAYLARRLSGLPRIDQLARLVYQRTEGNPLFMVNLVESWLTHGVLLEQDGACALPAGLEALHDSVPESLRQMIDRQLDGLSAEEQRVLEAASVAGMAFSAAAVAAGLAQETERVDDGCTALARREQFLRASGEQTWPDGTVAGGYRFVHALYQQVLYNRVSAARRIRLHQRIGTRLEAGHGTEAGAMAAELAMHFERGRDYPRAVQYLQLAGQQAVQRAAYVEAISHVTTALELLKTLPDTVERAQLELGLLTALAPALQITKGEAASELEPVLTRAEALAQQVGEPSQRFAVLRSLWTFRHTRAEYRAAQAAAEQLLDLAQHQHDPALLLRVHHALGQTLYQLGAFAPARSHFEQGITLDAPQRHATTHTTPGEMRNYGVRCRGLVSRVLWDLGYPNQAVQRVQEALTMAHALAHPFSLSVTLHESVLLHGCLREWRTVQSHAETVLALAIEHGFTRYVAMATYQRGRALAAQGLGAEGIAQMRQALAAVRATRTALGMPNFLAWLAQACGQAGQVDDGLHLLAEALAMVGTTGERRNEAELHRLHGELLLRQTVPEVQVVEACFQQALTIAHRQQARSWELRAAMSLSRLWQCQGKRTAAYELLAPIYSWFIEGFDTVDLQEAKMLLEELA